MGIDPLENVRSIASRCNKAELLNLRVNCLARNNPSAVEICERELDARFPNWEVGDPVRTRRGGTVPTTARFKNSTQKFPSQIDAYIWLVNQFAANNSNMFKSHGKDDVSYLRLLFGYRKDGAMHFAPTPDFLHKKTGKGIENDSRPVRLDCGWWANTNLSSTQKHRLLEDLAAHCKIKDDEWSWAPEIKTPKY